MVSGAFIGSDMQQPEEKTFLEETMKVVCYGKNSDKENTIKGMGTSFNFFRELNEKHYAAPHTDVLMPATPVGGDSPNQAFPAMVYANETSAAVAYQGKVYKSFTMGFPFECITDSGKRQSIMRAILIFLLTK